MRVASWLAGEVEFFAHAPEFEPFLGLRSPESDNIYKPYLETDHNRLDHLVRMFVVIQHDLVFVP